MANADALCQKALRLRREVLGAEYVDPSARGPPISSLENRRAWQRYRRGYGCAPPRRELHLGSAPAIRFSGMSGYPPTRPADPRLAVRNIAYTAIPPPAWVGGIAVGRRPPQTFSISSICAPSGAATQHTCRPLLTRSSSLRRWCAGIGAASVYTGVA